MPDNYIYCADVYCEACTEAIKARLRKEGCEPADPADERSYDSDEWPKGPFSDEEADSPQHCGSGPNCLEPTIIAGEKCGQFFENPLTRRGYHYVRDEASVGPVRNFWMKFYRILPHWKDRDGGRTEVIETPFGTLKAIVKRRNAWNRKGATRRQSLVGVNIRHIPKGLAAPVETKGCVTIEGTLLVHVPAFQGETRGQCRTRAFGIALSKLHDHPLDPQTPASIVADWCGEQSYHDLAKKLRK